MIKKVTLVFVVVFLLTAPAVLAGNGAAQGNYGEIAAYAENSDTGLAMSVETWGNIWGQQSCWISWYDQDGNYGFCFGEDNAFSVNVSNNVDCATFEANTVDLECVYEGEQQPPPSWWRDMMISVKCTPSGMYSYQTITATQSNSGGGPKSVYNSIQRFEDAYCAMTIDGTLFGEGYGGFSYKQGVEKYNPGR